jgi:gas vesicle protein
MTDIPFPGDDLREAGLRAARLGEAAERNGELAQAINLYRQSIHYLEQAGAPEAGQVWQRLTAAELKQKLEPVFQQQGDTLKNLIDQLADMNDEELTAHMEQLVKKIEQHEADKSSD